MTDIHVEQHLGYQTLMFNRPAKRNALHDGMYDGLREALVRGEADEGVRAHVLIGHPGVFTAGNDIGEFASKDWRATAVQPVVARMLPGGQGYVVTYLPPWEGFPTEDPVADAARMNRWIESEIRRLPAQYLWVHKRFKTRPDGEPPVY